jgi:hypothetical protein
MRDIRKYKSKVMELKLSGIQEQHLILKLNMDGNKKRQKVMKEGG